MNQARHRPTKKPPGLVRPEHAIRIEPVLSGPLSQPFLVQEDPLARGTHGSASRNELRETIHRLMPSRQSQGPPDRHNQRRKSRRPVRGSVA